jgi:hypothetical protein
VKQLNCVFCGTEVIAPPGLNDPSAKAICDSCVARGGRFPYMDGPHPWAVRVDLKGRVYCNSYEPRFEKAWIRGYFFRTPLDATMATFFLLIFCGLLLALLIRAPLPTVGFFVLMGVVYWVWIKVLPRWR